MNEIDGGARLEPSGLTGMFSSHALIFVGIGTIVAIWLIMFFLLPIFVHACQSFLLDIRNDQRKLLSGIREDLEGLRAQVAKLAPPATGVPSKAALADAASPTAAKPPHPGLRIAATPAPPPPRPAPPSPNNRVVVKEDEGLCYCPHCGAEFADFPADGGVCGSCRREVAP